MNAAVFKINTQDTSALRQAIVTSNTNNENDTIYLALKGTYSFTQGITSATIAIENESALPDIKKDGNKTLVIFANGSVIERALNAPDFRIMLIASADVSIYDLHLRNGSIANLKNGAGIANYEGTLSLYNCTLSNNKKAFLGGGIYATVSAVTNLTSCTITNCTASTGSALYFYSGNGYISNCTISGNVTTTNNGNAVDNALITDDVNRRITATNTIIALNTNLSGNPADIGGVIKTGTHNLIGVNDDSNSLIYMPAGNPSYVNDYVGTAISPIDPLLNALADNGGLTPTMSLQSTSSPAFNGAGLAAYSPATDQAGNNRIGNPEIGSMEFNNNTILNPHINLKQGTTSISNNSGQYSFQNTEPGNSTAITFTIENTGFFQKLNLLSHPPIFISGADSLDFIIDSIGTQNKIAGNGSTTFKIIFTPQSTGNKTATVWLASNDTDVPFYSFHIDGSAAVLTSVNHLQNEIAFENPYPNPSPTGKYTISYKAAEGTTAFYRIYNLQGQLIQENVNSNSCFQIQVPENTNGFINILLYNKEGQLINEKTFEISGL